MKRSPHFSNPRDHGGDAELRALERRATAGDRQARGQLRRERQRRGIHDPAFDGAKRLYDRARSLLDLSADYLEEFLQGYGDCVFWSEGEFAEPDDPEQITFEDLGLSFPEDVAPRTLARMRRDCLRFISANWRDLQESGLAASRAGFCFNLSRQGHGSGFFDEGSDPVFERLQDAASEFGEINFYFTGDVLARLNGDEEAGRGVVAAPDVIRRP